MAQESGKNEKRIDIPYIDGVNSVVGYSIARRQEMAHAENLRSKTIATVEKREGQIVLGTNANGGRFSALDNYGLFNFETTNGNSQDVFRITRSNEPLGSTLSVDVYDSLSVVDMNNKALDDSPLDILSIYAVENITITEPTFAGAFDTATFSIDNEDYLANIYHLNTSGVWEKMSDSDAQSIPGGDFTTAQVDKKRFLVNGRAQNRYIQSDGTTVTTATAGGDLFNSPRAKLVNYYKNRVYLGNFTRDGISYPTSVVRSSYPLGIISLVNDDVTAAVSSTWTIPMTETKYFYTDSGANSYEVYRGGSKVATLTAATITETGITAANANVTFEAGFSSFLAADEVWIAGTFSGEKQYRWTNNPTATGRDFKQYDTFKMGNQNDDELTVITNVGNVMLLATKNNLATWDDYTLEQADLGIGIVSTRGHVTTYGTLFFVHYTGIYQTSGSNVPSIISNPVQPYIDGATREGLENAAAGAKGRSVFFCIGDVTLYKSDGSVRRVLRDVCLEYSIIEENWYVHTNVKASQFAKFVDTSDSNRLLLTDSDTHDVKAFLEGLTDDGKAIISSAEFHPILLGDQFENVSNPTNIIVEAERGTLSKCFIEIDGEGFYELDGNIEKGASSIKVHGKDSSRGTPPIGRKITVALKDSSKQRCKYTKLAITYMPTNTSRPE